MHIRCPHCHNPVDVVEETEMSDVKCPSCGSDINLVGDDDKTATFRPKRETIAHFELLDKLGMGQFGSVWKAKDSELDRFVAIKIPRSSDLDSQEADWFFREARAAAQLSHPNIVSVHEVGRDDGTLYIVSDFIDGADLQSWISRRRLSSKEAAELMIKIVDAVHSAHEAGVTHRDLKPSNILIDHDGEPHVADFGLAKREKGEITMTVQGQLLGTPAYMSPEQAKGEAHEADARSDIYTLGVILYELLTGEIPFRGDKRMLLMQIINDEPTPPRKLAQIPRDLETICLKCLRKEANRRYDSAKELADDLRRQVNNEPIKARPVGRVEKALLWCRRRPAIAGSIAAIALVVVVATRIVLLQREVNRQKNSSTLVTSLLNAPPEAIPYVIDSLKPLRSHATGHLRAVISGDSANQTQKLHAAFGLAQLENDVQTDLIVGGIAYSGGDECANIVTSLSKQKANSIAALVAMAKEADKAKD